MMGFTTTEDAAQADAVVGAIAMDEDGLATVQAGAPYVGYTENAIELVQESILPALQYDYTDGKDCLGYVIYPEKTLVNASFLTGTSYVNTAE